MLIAAGTLVGAAVITVIVWAVWPRSGSPPTAGYGGALTITFTPEASPADRAGVLATCGRLPGVLGYTMTEHGTATMSIPWAGEIGGSNAVKARHQDERQRIYACLKASPFVASTLEGL